MNRFFTDLGGTTYYNILTQYSNAPSSSGPGPTIQNVADLAGTVPAAPSTDAIELPPGSQPGSRRESLGGSTPSARGHTWEIAG